MVAKIAVATCGSIINMAKGNFTNHPEYATWRDFTIEFLNTLPKSQREAKLTTGNKFYFNGPCLNGHTRARYTSNKCCCECLANKNKKKEYQARYLAKEKLEPALGPTGKKFKLFGMNVAILQ